MISSTRSAAMALCRRWRLGRRIGLPPMRPESLAKAMIEPVKVKAPMATPRLISIRLSPRMCPASMMPKASGA